MDLFGRNIVHVRVLYISIDFLVHVVWICCWKNNCPITVQNLNWFEPVECFCMILFVCIKEWYGKVNVSNLCARIWHYCNTRRGHTKTRPAKITSPTWVPQEMKANESWIEYCMCKEKPIKTIVLWLNNCWRMIILHAVNVMQIHINKERQLWETCTIQ